MRRVLLAAGAVLALAAAAPAHAATVTDAVGDFLPTYVGPEDADLDVISFSVVFDDVADAFRLTAAMAGDIDPSRAGLYAIGVNTGAAVAPGPFADIGNPDVIFNRVVVVQKAGTAFVVGAPPGNPLATTIVGNVLSVVVPLSLLPSTGLQPERYGFNIWPRIALGNNNQISDFSPNNSTLAAVPEPATWALMIAGFGLAGGLLRRRNLRTAVPV
jgi:hypothetical protein